MDIKKIKHFLQSILPSFIKNNKNGDKIAHAIYGLLFYLLLSIFIDNTLALLLTWSVAALIEAQDASTHKGDMLDFLATIILPTLIYIIF